MCVIIVAPQGTDIDKSILDKAIERNPHGWGFSFRAKSGKFFIAKGWSPEAAWRTWRRAGKDVTRVFHARISTSGEIDLVNLHPFDATGPDGVNRLLYHNGMVNMPRFDDSKSDTWHLAAALRAFPHGEKDGEELRKALNSYAQSQTSRFAFVTPELVYMMGSGWIKRDGVHYSNGSCLGAEKIGPKAWGGGLLHEPGTQSDKHMEGFVYDTETKTYVPDPKWKARTQTVYGATGIRTGGTNAHGWEAALHRDKRINPDTKYRPVASFYRWAEPDGRWFQYNQDLRNPDGGKRGGKELVEGPHPGSVHYAKPKADGWGLVMDPTSYRVLGAYEYKDLTDYIKREFKVPEPPPLPPEEEDEEDTVKGVKRFQSARALTQTELDLWMQAMEDPALQALPDGEVLSLIRSGNFKKVS